MSRKVVASAAIVAGAISAAVAMSASVQPAHAAKMKCFGVAKAGQNDCGTANSTCAGTSKVDFQGDAWKYVETKSCEEIVIKMDGQPDRMGSDKPLSRDLPS